MVLEIGEPFFERHGPAAVFLGRFIPGLRTWASWLAGANRMRWRTFFMWNVLGGVCWATGVGLTAYFVGQSANSAIAKFGIYGLVAVVPALGGVLLLHLRHRRRQREPIRFGLMNGCLACELTSGERELPGAESTRRRTGSSSIALDRSASERSSSSLSATLPTSGTSTTWRPRS